MATVDELERIVAGLGGLPDTPRRLAGLGDLITTATSAGSHHHEVGRRLVRGQAEALTGEGVHSLKMVHAHKLFDPRRYPLFDLIGHLFAEPTTARAQMQNFLNRLRL